MVFLIILELQRLCWVFWNLFFTYSRVILATCLLFLLKAISNLFFSNNFFFIPPFWFFIFLFFQEVFELFFLYFPNRLSFESFSLVVDAFLSIFQLLAKNRFFTVFILSCLGFAFLTSNLTGQSGLHLFQVFCFLPYFICYSRLTNVMLVNGIGRVWVEFILRVDDNHLSSSRVSRLAGIDTPI